MNDKNKNILVIDLPRHPIGEKVIITGIVFKKRTFSHSEKGIFIKDITGTVLVLITKNEESILQNTTINVNMRLKIEGEIALNSKGLRIIKNVTNIVILGTLKTELSKLDELSELDSEMREHASRFLMSRICRNASNFLQHNHFTEFESRILSNRWYEDSLEPLLVSFPGFGSPIFLTISPAAQIIDFLTTTLISRAYTISTSFTSSYRFPNGSAETRVIVAKAMNLNLDEHEQLISNISTKILTAFNLETLSINKLLGEWPDKIDGINYLEKKLDQDLNLITFSTNIPVIGKNWDTRITTIIHLLDKEKNILAEGARELLGENIVISSLTIYPSQFLGLIEKAPWRQLQNLTKLFDGKR